ncbi:hypothetical protein [Pontibacter sp. G13]|uniref:hypothetical protein n=1 Tax=Pontibacter sp. G13 TaxID=3074898 RepID=UPI00288B393A|nr:hypothetical protein [Pontibacter sp. G13]WNJ17448.1 hypothetical protein RJD25_21585 [Pontibacter sp. G13]
MLELILFIGTSFHIHKLAKSRDLKPTSWVLRNILACFSTYMLGLMIVLYQYPEMAEVAQGSSLENLAEKSQEMAQIVPFWVSFLPMVLAFGGFLLIKSSLERIPVDESAEI